MTIRVDPALSMMPRHLQDDFSREVGSPRGGPIAAAVLPLNQELLNRQARIEALTAQVKLANQRTDDAKLCAAEAVVASVMIITAAIPVMREYARQNPKHHFDGVLQDPCGVHAWLAEYEILISRINTSKP